jgi:hypothetical protein
VLAVAVGAETLRLRIAGVEHDPKNPDLLLYDLRIVEPGGAERPFCGPDPDGRRLGFPLAGRTDPTGALRPDATAFEMVCTAGAQGKCVRFGYRPWQGGADGRGLDRYNACVRAVRADYCGEGRSHTRDGTLIGLREPPGSEAKAADDVPADFRFEAAWGPHGALCVAHTRQPDLLGLDDLAKTCPRLAADLGPERCTPDRAGALILNESR